MRTHTNVSQLAAGLIRAGFEPKPCAHRHADHTSWEYRPQGGTTGSGLPLYVVHLDVAGPASVAHGFAHSGPADTDEHWQGRFTPLTRALMWAIDHGKKD